MISREEFLSKYTSHLNEKQLRAVQSVNGPVLLLAVPGSGKTTVLVNRLGYMMYCEGISPENILTLTYTVAATNDMARRFESVFGHDYSGALEFRTINGICAKIIVRYGQMIGKTPFKLVSDEKSTGKILTDAKYDDKGKVKNFTVLFDDNGIEKTFAFPMAFIAGMQLESGVNVPICHHISNNVHNKMVQIDGLSQK